MPFARLLLSLRHFIFAFISFLQLIAMPLMPPYCCRFDFAMLFYAMLFIIFHFFAFSLYLMIIILA